MEFLVIWLTTVVASYSLDLANGLRMYKDVADNGYKINNKRLSKLGKQLNPNASKVTSLTRLIPMLNLIQVFQNVVQYNNIRPMVLDQLRVTDSLEEMSEIEKEEYSKNPTGLNAVIIPFKSEIRLANAEHITIQVENENSEIFYEVGDSLKDITILKVIGDASRLTVEEQKQKIIETMRGIIQSGIEKYGDIESLVNAMISNKNTDLSDKIDDDNYEDNESIPQNSDIIKQKQALKDLKEEL